MRSKDLDSAVASLRRLLSVPDLEPAHRERLAKGLRELEKLKGGGTMDRRRLARVVRALSDAALEAFFRERNS